MARDKKLVESITSMEDDFAQWYTDVVKKAELCDYASVKGCMVIKPDGYAIQRKERIIPPHHLQMLWIQKDFLSAISRT